MAIAEGSKQYFAYKKESTANTEETGTGGTKLRRVTGTLNLTKQEVTSSEKRSDFQEVNVNHGTRSVDFSLQGELTGTDFAPFIAAMLRRDYAAVSDISADLTISSGVLSRASGDFAADGLRVGQVVRLAGMDGASNARNVLVTAYNSATSVDILAIDGGNPIPDDTGTGATLSVPGKVTFIPLTGHTSDTFTIEKHDTATDTSDIARGCKVGSLEIGVTPDQQVSVDFSGIGVDRRSVSGSDAPVLTSPAEAGANRTVSAGIGVARLNGATVAVMTGLTINEDVGLSNQAVAFGNTSPDVFYGRAAQFTGSVSVLREGNTFTNIFDDETEIEMFFFMEAPGVAPKSFQSFYMPRVKFNSVSDSDPDGPVIQEISFRAFLPETATTGNERTSLMTQDSTLTA